ncbi:hypothetical protein HH310_42285 [Actinoplanes sp. TBRC 11911]|uniref:hypothetical protein n=1 Tax=Actinoplanes sp. TBRC 11911 TaxID=2729386 RepID=UPI00145C57B3|nr:hypothetical protein [Actinoplanes sp. TBRC 11911]NMO57779.1 hypothetical protein [Actinoplanes sp. TBRC 11911]
MVYTAGGRPLVDANTVVQRGGQTRMNAQPDPAASPGADARLFDDGVPMQHDDARVVTDDIPIAVWRLTARDGSAPTADPGAVLAPRLARRLVLVYTRHGDVVIDFDGDPHLQTATTDASRSYVLITDTSKIAELDGITAPISLIVLRWPPRNTVAAAADFRDLFAACRLIMTAETSAIAIVSSSAPGQPGTTYAEHIAELLPAARAADLTHVLQIVAVTGQHDGDEFLYYATPTEAEAARQRQPADGYHVDLLVFASESDRRD